MRAHNTAFHSRAGRFPAALSLLQLAGFTDDGPTHTPASNVDQFSSTVASVPGKSADERVLLLRRNDPGLLWLVLSAVTAGLGSGQNSTEPVAMIRI